MPNKTIYVSESDQPLYERAQQLTGGNLSAAITTALRRLVEIEEGKGAGFEEVVVRVGVGGTTRQRFLGIQLAEWGRTLKDGTTEEFRVYRSRTGKYPVHTQRSESHTWTAGSDGKASGLRKALASEQQWGTVPASGTLEIYQTRDELRDAVPEPLYELVVAVDADPVIEDLDI